MEIEIVAKRLRPNVKPWAFGQKLQLSARLLLHRLPIAG
jgi:hypothetical protein